MRLVLVVLGLLALFIFPPRVIANGDGCSSLGPLSGYASLSTPSMPATNCLSPGTSNWQSAASEETQSGLRGGIEVMMLRPFLSGAAPVFNLATGNVRQVEGEFRTGLRYTIAQELSQGLAIRGRYFDYSHDFNVAPAFAPQRWGIDLTVAEMEITGRHELQNWIVDFSGGLEYGKLGYTTASPGVVNVGHVRFEGTGPTVSAGVSRALGDSRFSVFGNVRSAFLFGQIRNGALLVNMPRGTIRDEFAQHYQHQLGISYHCKPGRCAVELRGIWESQFWFNDTLADDVFGVGSNLALSGPALQLQIEF